MRGFARIALLALLAAVSGCAGLRQFDSWPIISVEPEEENKSSDVRAVGPLFRYQSKDNLSQWDVVPLFSVRGYEDIRRDERLYYDLPYFVPYALTTPFIRQNIPQEAAEGEESRDGTQILGLLHLFRMEEAEPQSRTLFKPLYYNYEDVNFNDGRWHHWMVFPYFGGNSTKYGRYNALFPVGGTMKNVFGRDKIGFVLFPVYIYEYSGGRTAHWVVFPFFRYTYGGDREQWHLWPLIGRVRRFDQPPRYFFLWPFFWANRLKDPKNTENDAFIAFPVFSYIRRGAFTRHDVIWPLFNREKNSKTGRYDLVAPWPIFRYGYGPDYSRLQVWPFAGHIEDRQVSRQYYLWPFFRFEQKDTELNTMRSRSIMLLYRDVRDQWYTSDGSERSTRENIIWPLYYYKRDGEGNSYFCFTEFRVIPDPQGWDRYLAPIWRIVEHEKRVNTPDGDRRMTSILWGAFKYDRDDRSSFLRIFPAVTLRRESGKQKGIEILAGMFGYIDLEDSRTYRVLFIPVSVKR